MRFAAACVVVIVTAAVFAQNAPKPPPKPESATVPVTLDQGRVVIDVDLPRPDGSTERIRGWVDNGNPDLYMTQRVANLLGFTVRCDGQICSATPKSPQVSLDIAIGGMKISLTQVGEKTRAIKVPRGTPALAPGMSAEINIPSSVLHNYDILFNFPDRQFTIARPGSLKFNGVKSKMLVNATTGLIQIPSKIENKNYDLGLDLGSSVSFLSPELFAKLSRAHADWPRMTGAVGPFNTGELTDETKLKLMRVDRVQYGPLFLTYVPVAEFPAELPAELASDVPADLLNDRLTAVFEDRPTAGLLSAEALMNYRIGFDYARSTVYFDIGRTIRFPDFDVIGLILRPEGDTAFAIAGVADFDGKPSVPNLQLGDRLIAIDEIAIADSTLGQVWALLEGSPGQERRLTIERASKRFAVAAKVQHFLGSSN
jgi:hypothetical protein